MATDISIILETYNLVEGSDIARLKLSLDAAQAMAHGRDDIEVLVADSSGSRDIVELLRTSYPTIRRVDCIGHGYDQAKMKTATHAKGKYVVFLDGDCIPGEGWLDAHLDVLRSGKAHASGGFTRYEGGFLGALATIHDFGFLFPNQHRPLGCYPSNNVAFEKALLLKMPMPEGPLRCSCYAHAQLLARSGTPVYFAPDAAARHEPQPFFKERYRRGFDEVAACWMDPELPEARLLRFGLLAAPVFYWRRVALDIRGLYYWWRDLGLSRPKTALGIVLVPLFNLVDLAGVMRALAPGGRKSGVGLSKA